MTKFTLNVLPASICLALSLVALAEPVTEGQYTVAKQDISAKYTAEKTACKAMNGNAKDICMEEAKGREKIAKSTLEAEYSPSVQHRRDVRLVKVDVAYSIAKEKCDDQTGNAKTVCRKEAKSAYVSAKADASVAEKTADANATAREKIGDAQNTAQKKVNDAASTAQQKGSDARKDAATDKRDAEYAVAKAKCDALAGDAKTNCVKDAKVHYGQ